MTQRFVMTMKLLAVLVIALWIGSCNRAAPPAADTKTTIVDKLQADGNFKALLAAMSTTGLVDTLRGNGPFTLFAPTDDAFAAAEEGLQYRGARITERGPRRVHPLPKDRTLLLQALQNHVVYGKLLAADLVKQIEGKTVNDMTISFDIKGDINELKSRPSDAIRKPTDMFMVNLGPAGKFSEKAYDANLIRTDIEGSNGVIHVIDAVLLHPMEEESPKKQ